MTTKWKIITGFAAMILLLSIIAVIAVMGLSGALDSFQNYSRMARLDSIYAMLNANQYAATASVNAYRSSQDPKALDDARGFITRNRALMEEGRRRLIWFFSLRSVNGSGGKRCISSRSSSTILIISRRVLPGPA